MKKTLLAALFFLLAIPFLIFPASAAEEEPEEHSLQIQYLNEDGSQAFPAYSARIAEGEEYSVESPVSEELSPDFEIVSGIMGNEDVSEVVTYGLKYYVYAKTTSRRTGKNLGTFTFGPNDGNYTGICRAPSIIGYSSPNPTEVKVFMNYQNQNITFTYSPNLYNVTFNFLYSDGTVAFEPRTTLIYYDDPVRVSCPPLEGYQPLCGAFEQPLKSTASDTSFDVVYTPKDCSLTIKYQYTDGSEAFPPHTETVKYSGNYSVESPALDHYVPDIPTVSGTMNSETLEMVVTYSPKVSNLIIDYVYQNGGKAAPTVTKPLEYNQSYNIPSPFVLGYNPNIPVVSGTMGTEDVHVTVTYGKGPYLLTIKYQYENGRSASSAYTRSYKPGENYTITSPSIRGHTADKPAVSGAMPSENLTITVIYSPVPHVLTILYRYENGTEAAPPYTASVKYGESFKVPSPVIPKFTPERSVIPGKMGDADATFTVVYKPTKYLLTIKYNRQNGKLRTSGMKIAPDYTGRYAEGESYEIPSPLVIGHETEIMTVSGVMPAHNVIETVSYRLAGEPVIGDTSKLLNVISSSGEYIQIYISKTLLTMVTAGLVIFAALMVIRVILGVLKRFTRS